MRLVDADELSDTIMKQECWNVPDFVYESIKNAKTICAIPWNVAIRSLDTVPLERMIDRYEYSGKLKKWLMENDREFRRKEEENQWWAEHSSRFD